MRIACSVSLLLAVVACTGRSNAPGPQSGRAQAGSQAPSSAAPTLIGGRNENGRTRLELGIDGRREVVIVDRDDSVLPDADPSKIDVVAASPGRAIVLMDRYRSKPGGLSFCQAGEEQFLRVIAVGPAGDRPAATYSTKVASCRDSIELAEPGVEWEASAFSLRIHWLTPPDGGATGRTIRIDAVGRVEVQP